MSRILRRIFLIIFLSLLIITGVAMHNKLNQSMNELDTALDQLELSLTELEKALGIEHE